MGESIEAIETELGLLDTGSRRLDPLEHRLSHVIMTIQPALAATVRSGHVKCSSGQRWHDPASRRIIGLPKPVNEILKRIDNGEIK